MEIQNEQSGSNAKEEVSLKQLILKISVWYRYLLTKWHIIGIITLLGAALGLLFGLFERPKYAGELTFVLEDGSKSGGLAAYAGIASQLGVNLGGGGSVGVFSTDNILGFLKTRLMVENALLSPVDIDGKVISLADFYVDISGMREKWRKDPKTKGKDYHFPPSIDQREKFSREEDSVLASLYNQIVNKELTVNKPDKKTSFISVKTTSTNELFAQIFTERLVKVATDFYIATKTQRSSNNVKILQAKADSILKLMNEKTYSAAINRDLNQNPVRQIATVNTELVTRDKTVLQTIYATVVQNLELSKLSMAQEMPIIQIVDRPIMPLKREGIGKLTATIIGGFIASFLAVIFLILRKMIKAVMA